MTRTLWCWMGMALTLAATAPAQPLCLGDCDASGAVSVDEILRCVGVALGAGAPGRCPACDPDGDGQIPIADLVTAVHHLLDGCTSPSPPCGDGVTEGDEQCDDGNTAGGDGCAANCTREQRRTAMFDPEGTFAVVQSEALPIALPHLAGSQVLTTGSARPARVVDPQGRLLTEPGDIPVTIRAGDLRFAPISIPGVRCACVRGITHEEFGPGNIGGGVIACGGSGLAAVDATLAVDHDTTPGSPANGGSASGLPDDRECDDCTEVGPFASRSCACEEGRDVACSTEHPGDCHSPRLLTRSGGAAPPGSAFLVLGIAIDLLEDRGTCGVDARDNRGNCRHPDYGPDCQPCTGDDVMLGIPNLVVATTGRAAAAVIDANHRAGARIADGSDCYGSPCRATADGHPFSCAQLAADPGGGLTGGALAVCFPGIDTVPLADTVTCTRLAAQ